MNVTLALIIALVGSNVGLWTYMRVREAVVVQNARFEERTAGVRACNMRVADIERAHNDAVALAVAEARKASESVPPTPESDAEIKALCKASASCRAKGDL